MCVWFQQGIELTLQRRQIFHRQKFDPSDVIDSLKSSNYHENLITHLLQYFVNDVMWFHFLFLHSSFPCDCGDKYSVTWWSKINTNRKNVFTAKILHRNDHFVNSYYTLAFWWLKMNWIANLLIFPVDWVALKFTMIHVWMSYRKRNATIIKRGKTTHFIYQSKLVSVWLLSKDVETLGQLCSLFSQVLMKLYCG